MGSPGPLLSARHGACACGDEPRQHRRGNTGLGMWGSASPESSRFHRSPHSAEALGVPQFLLSVETAQPVSVSSWSGSLPARGQGLPAEGQGRESLRWHLSPWFHRSFKEE